MSLRRRTLIATPIVLAFISAPLHALQVSTAEVAPSANVAINMRGGWRDVIRDVFRDAAQNDRRDQRRDRDNDRDRDRNRDRDRDENRDRDRDRDRSRRDDGRLSWRGRVDDVAEIRIQGRDIEYRSRSGQPLRDVRATLRGAPLPRHAVSLALDVDRGRGQVMVVQQPNAYNRYTLVLRVVDRRAGYGDYDFDVDWF